LLLSWIKKRRLFHRTLKLVLTGKYNPTHFIHEVSSFQLRRGHSIKRKNLRNDSCYYTPLSIAQSANYIPPFYLGCVYFSFCFCLLWGTTLHNKKHKSKSSKFMLFLLCILLLVMDPLLKTNTVAKTSIHLAEMKCDLCLLR